MDLIKEDKMKKIVAMILTASLVFAMTASAGNMVSTPISKILQHKDALGLTDGQVKKLSIIEDSAAQRMFEAKTQADIRLKEIEEFTSNWTNMNSTAVKSLLKEYYNFMEQYKATELNAIVQARAILEFTQLTRYQQLVSMESLMLDMEKEVALR